MWAYEEVFDSAKNVWASVGECRQAFRYIRENIEIHEINGNQNIKTGDQSWRWDCQNVDAKVHTYALQLNKRGNKNFSQGTNILQVIVRKNLPENLPGLRALLNGINENTFWAGPNGGKKTLRVYNK